MMRVTTNSTLYSYQKNLLKSSNQLYSAMNSMMTGRKFDTYSADPAAATQAFKLHSSLNATNTQYSNNTAMLNKISTAWDVADGMIDKLVRDLGEATALKGLNDTNLSTLNTQGQVIYSGAEAMVQSLNSQYGDSFLFNGADSENPPFALETEDDRTYVTYRGVRIDDPVSLAQPYVDENGEQVMKEDGVTPMTNQEMLDQWAKETQYVDIGLGFELDGMGQILDSTAFNCAISGTEFIGGCGVDEDGDPTNIVSIMVRLSEVFKGYNQETGEWGDAGNKEDAERLTRKLAAAQENLSASHTELATQATYLETNQSQLEDRFNAQNTELVNIEKVDEVEAILALSAAQTSYNAALQVGANLIPQSLMDYLN